MRLPKLFYIVVGVVLVTVIIISLNNKPSLTGVTTTLARDSTAIDTDGDGVFDWLEDLSGTDKNDPKSFPAKSEITEERIPDETFDAGQIIARNLTFNGLQWELTGTTPEEVAQEVTDFIEKGIAENPVFVPRINTFPSTDTNKLEEFALSFTENLSERLLSKQVPTEIFSDYIENKTSIAPLKQSADDFLSYAEYLQDQKVPDILEIEYTALVQNLLLISHVLFGFIGDSEDPSKTFKVVQILTVFFDPQENLEGNSWFFVPIATLLNTLESIDN